MKMSEKLLFEVRISQFKNLKSYTSSIFIIALLMFFYKDINEGLLYLVEKLNLINIENLVFLINSINYLVPIIIFIILLKQVYNYYAVKNEVYFFMEERIKIATGVFNKTYDNLEYYDIIDHAIKKPFIYRFFNLSNCYLETIDASHRNFKIKAAKNIYENELLLRNTIERIKNSGKGQRIAIA